MSKKYIHLIGGLAFALYPVLFGIQSASAIDDGLAKTPPMGWNSWNKFRCNVSESLIKETADAMAKSIKDGGSGMKDAGYDTVVIDDCWQISRDSNGNIQADAKNFPNGIKALADYVHSKGLKFGLYSDAGTMTCEKRPGSKGYEEQDARQYAAWGVDYVKYDWCNTDGMDAKEAYTKMSSALKNSGRPIIFSMCEWGTSKPWLWAKDVGHLWRTTSDILDCWDCTLPWGALGWTKILALQENLGSYAGPGHWNDPDMLEVGNGGMTDTEYQAHFSMWCMLSAPLIAGNDIRKMSKATREILTNKEVIAVDQDPLGSPATKIARDANTEVWWKKLADGSIAVALFNQSTKKQNISVSWKEIGLTASQSAVRDLWQKKDMGKFKDSYSAKVKGHQVVMLKVVPVI